MSLDGGDTGTPITTHYVMDDVRRQQPLIQTLEGREGEVTYPVTTCVSS